MAIPFTLCSLLFCHARTRERARVARRHHPGDPGSRPGKSPQARSTHRIPSGSSGTGEGNVRVKSPSPRVAPALQIRFVDFQPDTVIAVTVVFSLRSVIAAKRNITGYPSAYRVRACKTKIRQYHRRSGYRLSASADRRPLAGSGPLYHRRPRLYPASDRYPPSIPVASLQYRNRSGLRL